LAGFGFHWYLSITVMMLSAGMGVRPVSELILVRGVLRQQSGRVGRADDIAETIDLLIANTFISGQTIICDCGFLFNIYQRQH